MFGAAGFPECFINHAIFWQTLVTKINKKDVFESKWANIVLMQVFQVVQELWMIQFSDDISHVLETEW